MVGRFEKNLRGEKPQYFSITDYFGMILGALKKDLPFSHNLHGELYGIGKGQKVHSGPKLQSLLEKFLRRIKGD
jgi:hypothetical protein